MWTQYSVGWVHSSMSLACLNLTSPLEKKSCSCFEKYRCVTCLFSWWSKKIISCMIWSFRCLAVIYIPWNQYVSRWEHRDGKTIFSHHKNKLYPCVCVCVCVKKRREKCYGHRDRFPSFKNDAVQTHEIPSLQHRWWCTALQPHATTTLQEICKTLEDFVSLCIFQSTEQSIEWKKTKE